MKFSTFRVLSYFDINISAPERYFLSRWEIQIHKVRSYKNVLINPRDDEVKSKWKNNNVIINCCHSLRLLSYRGGNTGLFRFMYLFLILFIWKSFIKRIAVCCFLRSHILVRVSRIIFLAFLSPRWYCSINRWTHIVNNDWFYNYSSFKYLSCRQFFEYSVCEKPSVFRF